MSSMLVLDNFGGCSSGCSTNRLGTTKNQKLKVKKHIYI